MLPSIGEATLLGDKGAAVEGALVMPDNRVEEPALVLLDAPGPDEPTEEGPCVAFKLLLLLLLLPDPSPRFIWPNLEPLTSRNDRASLSGISGAMNEEPSLEGLAPLPWFCGEKVAAEIPWGFRSCSKLIKYWIKFCIN